LTEAATVPFTLPRLTVDADEGAVQAVGLARGGAYRVRARRVGVDVAAASLVVDSVGDGSTRLATAGGQPIALAAGDVVEAIAADGSVVAMVAIPAVSVARLDGDVVAGRITLPPPMRLNVRVDRLFGLPRLFENQVAFSQAVAHVDATGRFTATLTPSQDFTRAAVVKFEAQDGHGNTVIRRHYAPLLIIGVDSDALCGATGIPGAAVHVALTTTAGATITRTLTSGTSGWFELHGGPTLRFAPGDRATVTIDMAAPSLPLVIAADVPPIAVTRFGPQNVNRLHVTGMTEGARVFASADDDPLCASGPLPAHERPAASENGRVYGQSGFDSGLHVGQALEYAFVPPDGGPIFYRRYVAAGVRAHLDTGAVDVPLSTFRSGRLTLVDAAGRTRHVAPVHTDDVPLARVTLPADVLPRTGDAILAALDGVTDTVPIEPFTFERRPDGTLAGRVADPSRVRIRFPLADGRVAESAPSRLGKDTFAVDAQDVADVAAVFGSPVVTVEAVVVLAYGHELIREPSEPGAEPAPSPTATSGADTPRRGTRIWLPFAYQYVRRRP
ncbi:MAG: hypothetical protein ABI780_14100, partial [Ardenticatenales bacterium]